VGLLGHNHFYAATFSNLLFSLIYILLSRHVKSCFLLHSKKNAPRTPWGAQRSVNNWVFWQRPGKVWDESRSLYRRVAYLSFVFTHIGAMCFQCSFCLTDGQYFYFFTGPVSLFWWLLLVALNRNDTGSTNLRNHSSTLESLSFSVFMIILKHQYIIHFIIYRRRHTKRQRATFRGLASECEWHIINLNDLLAWFEGNFGSKINTDIGSEELMNVFF